jgi:hypothetical protein
LNCWCLLISLISAIKRNYKHWSETVCQSKCSLYSWGEILPSPCGTSHDHIISVNIKHVSWTVPFSFLYYNHAKWSFIGLEQSSNITDFLLLLRHSIQNRIQKYSTQNRLRKAWSHSGCKMHFIETKTSSFTRINNLRVK